MRNYYLHPTHFYHYFPFSALMTLSALLHSLRSATSSPFLVFKNADIHPDDFDINFC